MSRIGKQPITIPTGVEVKVQGNLVRVKGPKGSLERTAHPAMKLVTENDTLRVERPTDQGFHRALHGTTRMLIANMIRGVTEGFSKDLEIQGIGYKAEVQGQKLTLILSMSHPVIYEVREGIKVEVPIPTKIVVSGIDKELVGQVAAEIRRIDPPEPYKGKGIRYVGEYVKRKAGKTGAAQA
ncbi:MAG: 50S ribosomal protein L6 [Candidatus Eisenbacteria bacterium]